jgi:hypothetical protein
VAKYLTEEWPRRAEGKMETHIQDAKREET